MAEQTLPPRSEIAPEHTWNAPSVYESNEAWETALVAASEQIAAFTEQFKGKLATSPATLANGLNTAGELHMQVGKAYVYAHMFSAVDTGDQNATAMVGRAGSVYGQYVAAASFIDPELLAIGRDTLRQWMQNEPRLAAYEHYIDDLFRQQAHVRSAEVEEVLGMLAEPFNSLSQTASVLSNADLTFAPAVTADGESISVEQGNINEHFTSPDRVRRQSAYESYTDGYLAFKNTFASNLDAALKRDVFRARVRGHASSLEAALFPNNIPVAVFENLIETFKRNLPTWHRYWNIRRKIIGVETLYPYDTWAPLTLKPPTVPYEQAIDWISAGLEPLGEDYVNVLRRGALEQRWVDIYPNQGKRQGAFSSGLKGTHPFINMSYSDSLNDMSTLAHELGHSLHSYLTWANQPVQYSGYSLFVAEVASNFNQAMTRAYLLKHNDDPDFQIALIDEAMYNFHRYFLQMPTLARFELETHQRVERGAGLTANSMIELMADLFGEVYGDEMAYERDRVGITWATFSHLYANFYVFQYATGISAAHALAQNILDDVPNSVENYLAFLRAGSSLYPLDALKLAGVDMTSPEAVETTFGVLAGYVDRLAELTGNA